MVREELANWMAEQKSKGHKDSDIERVLEKSGYEKKEIKKLFHHHKKTTKAAKKSASENVQTTVDTKSIAHQNKFAPQILGGILLFYAVYVILTYFYNFGEMGFEGLMMLMEGIAVIPFIVLFWKMYRHEGGSSHWLNISIFTYVSFLLYKWTVAIYISGFTVLIVPAIFEILIVWVIWKLYSNYCF